MNSAPVDYEYKHMKDLTPDEQAEQKQQIEQHLQNLLLQIVQCDEFYCPDIQELNVSAVYLAAASRHADLFEKFQHCMTLDEETPECDKIFMLLMQHNVPYLQERLEFKRQSYHKQPLKSYDGQKYNAPFWFEGAGNLWRISSHQPPERPYVSVHDCHQIRVASEQCLADPTKSKDECFKLYGHSLSCAAGLNCPELRFPLLFCLQSQHNVNFDGLKGCIQKIPDFDQCSLKPKKPWLPDWDKGDAPAQRDF